MPARPPHAPAAEEAARALYAEILRCWNERNALGFTRAFSRRGNLVGFDGSQVDGQEDIETHLSQIFTDHVPATYIGKVREVRMLGQEIVLLRAVAGMIPPNQSRLNPALNTIHTLVAAQHGDRYRVELFQSTPAAFHGRPADSEQLTEELQQLYDEQRKASPSR
jgi:uncharacterized protein (TIGR02246 family)